jgi:hypothetical protein
MLSEMPTFCRPGALALAALLFGSSCVTSAHLVANDGSHRLIARDPATGLTAVITTEAWIGDSAIDRDFAVIHILIDNRGTERVLLAPGDFELRDSRGFLYRLQDAGGTFTRSVDGNTDVAGNENYDPGGDFPYEHVAATDPDFARAALPWGILEPGTQMRGFLYFEPVAQSANHGFLVWHAQNPEHHALAKLGFELHVARVRHTRTHNEP